MDPDPRRRPGAPRPGRQRRAGHRRPGRARHRAGRRNHRAGMRGNVLPARPTRRHRSTKRRQDAPDLPRRKVTSRTVGKTYTAPDGKTFRPSMFLTLTCPSYGRVRDDGTPADPGSYDYARAARDALHFAALFDRFIQNLRRFLGYDVQYFAAVEPQRRLAPHIHIAMRGTVSRAELRRVLAATYHQVWWPDTSAVQFDGDERPVWDEQTCTYVDPYTGEVLPTWDQALDAIGDAGRAGARGPVRGPVRRPGRAVRLQGRGPVHRLPDQVPDQAGGRLPPGADRRRTGARRTAGRGAAVRAVLAPVRQLAPVRHPAQERPARPGPRRLQGQGPPPRTPRLRRAPGPDLAQVVGQDAGRPPGRPEELAAWPRSGFRQPTRPGTPGNRSPPATPTTWNTPGGCCTPSPTAPDGKPRSPKPDEKQPSQAGPDLSATGRAA